MGVFEEVVSFFGRGGKGGLAVLRGEGGDFLPHFKNSPS